MVGRSPSELCNTWKRSLENFVPFCWNIRRGEAKKDKKKIGKGGMYARDFYPMMDYRATANCSTLFLFFPRRKNSDLVRDRRCGIFAFFLSLNVNTHRL